MITMDDLTARQDFKAIHPGRRGTRWRGLDQPVNTNILMERDSAHILAGLLDSQQLVIRRQLPRSGYWSTDHTQKELTAPNGKRSRPNRDMIMPNLNQLL